MKYGCPVSCKYCMVSQIDSRSTKWLEKHRWGINKTVLFLNRLPNDIKVSEMKIDKELFAGEYVGFQGITDVFWDIFTEDLEYMADITNNSEMKRLVLASKEKINAEQWDILKSIDKRKLQLVISITGLDSIEKTSTKDRLINIENALKNNISVLPLIHPYIHTASDISFLKDLKSLGIKDIAYKGFRYNHQNMKIWAEDIIDKWALIIYKDGNEKEVMIGELYLENQIEYNNLNIVNFRDYIHRDNDIKGIPYTRAKKIVDGIFEQCTISSSDTYKNVYLKAIERRL